MIPLRLALVALLALVSVSAAKDLEKTYSQKLVDRSWDEIYNSVFGYSAEQMTGEELAKALKELKARVSIYLDHQSSVPKDQRYEVTFWSNAAVMNTSKCDNNFVRTIMDSMDRVRRKASKRKSTADQKHLNLARYALDILDTQVKFCKTYEKFLKREESNARQNAHLIGAGLGFGY